MRAAANDGVDVDDGMVVAYGDRELVEVTRARAAEALPAQVPERSSARVCERDVRDSPKRTERMVVENQATAEVRASPDERHDLAGRLAGDEHRSSAVLRLDGRAERCLDRSTSFQCAHIE